MHIEVTFRNLAAREEIRRRAEALYKKLHRFLDPASEAQLTVALEHGVAVVDLVVVNRGETFKQSEEDQDLRTALDKLMHGMEHQLRRSKERRMTRRTRTAAEREDGFAAPTTEEDELPAL